MKTFLAVLAVTAAVILGDALDKDYTGPTQYGYEDAPTSQNERYGW